jgi:hypothetical protein
VVVLLMLMNVRGSDRLGVVWLTSEMDISLSLRLSHTHTHSLCVCVCVCVRACISHSLTHLLFFFFFFPHARFWRVFKQLND